MVAANDFANKLPLSGIGSAMTLYCDLSVCFSQLLAGQYYTFYH